MTADTLPLLRYRSVQRNRQEQRYCRKNSNLDQFLAEVERRALRIAEIGVRDRDEALDLVQDAMIKLARKYRWATGRGVAPLFYRILAERCA